MFYWDNETSLYNMGSGSHIVVCVDDGFWETFMVAWSIENSTGDVVVVFELICQV